MVVRAPVFCMSSRMIPGDAMEMGSEYTSRLDGRARPGAACIRRRPPPPRPPQSQCHHITTTTNNNNNNNNE
jgi:hypothetical protein